MVEVNCKGYGYLGCLKCNLPEMRCLEHVLTSVMPKVMFLVLSQVAVNGRKTILAAPLSLYWGSSNMSNEVTCPVTCLIK